MMRLGWTGIGLAATLSFVACSDDGGNGSTDNGTGGIDGTGGSGGSSSTPCNENPWQCPDGQTCWLNMSADGFLCLNSGSGAEGEPCQNTVGQPTCADDLVCVMAPGAQGGVCSPYCDNTDPEHGCPDGRSCVTYQLEGGNLTFQACQPEEGTGGAGGTGGSGGSVGGAGGAGGSGGA